MKNTSHYTFANFLSIDTDLAAKASSSDRLHKYVRKFVKENCLTHGSVLSTHICIIFISQYVLKYGKRVLIDFVLLPIWTNKDNFFLVLDHYIELNKQEVLNKYKKELILNINNNPLFINFNSSTIGIPACNSYLEQASKLEKYFYEYLLRRSHATQIN